MAYQVELGEPISLYTRGIPAGAAALGVVTVAPGRAGALVRFRTGTYVKMNGAKMQLLDRNEVLQAMTAGLVGG